MKKIVRLTESDLVRLVKRVINEQREFPRAGTYNGIQVRDVSQSNQQAFIGATSRGPMFSMIEAEEIAKRIPNLLTPIYFFDNESQNRQNSNDPRQIYKIGMIVNQQMEITTQTGQQQSYGANSFLNICDYRVGDCRPKFHNYVTVTTMTSRGQKGTPIQIKF